MGYLPITRGIKYMFNLISLHQCSLIQMNSFGSYKVRFDSFITKKVDIFNALHTDVSQNSEQSNFVSGSLEITRLDLRALRNAWISENNKQQLFVVTYFLSLSCKLHGQSGREKYPLASFIYLWNENTVLVFYVLSVN